jgi:hypothetical protein
MQPARLKVVELMEGSARPMIQAACLEVLSRERLRAIERLSQCEEGDLSCPASRKESK